jgi:hypothetical protein
MDAGSSLVVSQLTLGAVFSWLLEALKNAKWFPILQQDGTKVANTLAGVISSIVAITGLTYVYDPTAHTLLIQNFGLALVGNAVWHWLTQFVMQQGWYEVVFNKVTPSTTQKVIAEKDSPVLPTPKSK